MTNSQTSVDLKIFDLNTFSYVNIFNCEHSKWQTEKSRVGREIEMGSSINNVIHNNNVIRDMNKYKLTKGHKKSFLSKLSLSTLYQVYPTFLFPYLQTEKTEIQRTPRSKKCILL
jgi:hypothetical protein